MIFVRRSGPPASRYVVQRVTLFFFAAGLWLAGFIAGNELVTGAAIGVAALGLALGLLARRRDPGDDDFDEGTDGSEGDFGDEFDDEPRDLSG